MPGREELIDPLVNLGMMSSWMSSNVDEMVWVAFAEKGSLPSKEEGH